MDGSTMDGLINGWINNGWMDQWMDQQWMDGSMDGPPKRPLATPRTASGHPENGLWPPPKRPLATPQSASSDMIELAVRILVSERSFKDARKRAHLGCCTPRMIRNPGSPREVLYPWFFIIFSIHFRSSLARLAVSLTHPNIKWFWFICSVIRVRPFQPLFIESFILIKRLLTL